MQQFDVVTAAKQVNASNSTFTMRAVWANGGVALQHNLLSDVKITALQLNVGRGYVGNLQVEWTCEGGAARADEVSTLLCYGHADTTVAEMLEVCGFSNAAADEVTVGEGDLQAEGNSEQGGVACFEGCEKLAKEVRKAGKYNWEQMCKRATERLKVEIA